MIYLFETMPFQIQTTSFQIQTTSFQIQTMSFEIQRIMRKNTPKVRQNDTNSGFFGGIS